MIEQKGKVALISVDEYGPSIGVRFLSAALKKAGYETVVIFAIGKVTPKVAMGETQVFTEHIHNEIAKLVEGSLYVGISVVTSTYHKAREITKQLKSRVATPIIWGGVHAIVKPDECLETADMICMGEGEDLVVALADRLRENQPYNDIPGLRLPNQLPVSVPLVDISCLSAPDYAFDGTHYFVHSRGIISFTRDLYKQFLYIDYYLAPTRGCPYKCTYCVNNKYAVLYKEAKIKRFRERNLDNVLNELIWAKNNLPFQRVIIDDDCFMAVKEDDIRYFAMEYQKHIGLPFVIRGAHPQYVTEEKLKLLCDAGLIQLRVGIQTGSERIRKLYDRSWENNTKILEMAQLINQFIKTGQLHHVMYDLILDNPWETEQDRIDTYNLMMSLPKPFGLYCFSLTFYPGTALFERALSEKLIRGNPTDDAYWRNFLELHPTPINEIFQLMKSLPLSSAIMRWLVKDTAFTNRIRRMLRKLVVRIPEISLFYKTRMRYEVDLVLMLQDKKGIKQSRTEYWQKTTEKSRIVLALRRILLNTYIGLWMRLPILSNKKNH
jgi:anaerobic magnesium-protoporphyrin IX monomethyl ester cyclase